MFIIKCVHANSRQLSQRKFVHIFRFIALERKHTNWRKEQMKQKGKSDTLFCLNFVFVCAFMSSFGVCFFHLLTIHSLLFVDPFSTLHLSVFSNQCGHLLTKRRNSAEKYYTESKRETTNEEWRRDPQTKLVHRVWTCKNHMPKRISEFANHYARFRV